MNKQYRKAIKKLQGMITTDSIFNVLKLLSHPETIENPRLVWYFYSYPVFLNVFSKTAKCFNREAWVKRVACVFSWISRIPTPDFEPHTLEMLVRIEELYSQEKLWEIGSESYLGGQGNSKRIRHHGERIFGADSSKPPMLLRDFLEPANRLLNGSDRWNKTLPTSTKLLHFICPSLFTIFDSKINKIFSLAKSPNYVGYHAYIFALQDFLVANRKFLEIIVGKNQNPLRVIDIILYNLN